MYRRREEIHVNDNKLEEIINLIQSKSKIRSPKSVDILKCVLNKIFLHLKTDINSYETIKKEDIDYNKLINLVHYKHISFIHKILINLFDFEKKELIRTYNFTYEIKPEDKSPDYISTEELNLMYSKANDIERLILYLFMSTGMRCSAVANINSIDYSTRTFLTLEKYNKEIRYKIVSPLIENLFKSTKYFDKKRNDKVIRRLVNNLKIKCGLENSKHIHPHAFRHTFAKMNLYSGIPVNNISKMLNHSETKITENVYLKERVIDVIDRIDCPFMSQDEFIFVKPQIWIDLKNNGY